MSARDSHDHHHILLVDDDPDILDALGTLLEMGGIEVERAPSAFSALIMYVRSNGTIALSSAVSDSSFSR